MQLKLHGGLVFWLHYHILDFGRFTLPCICRSAILL